MNLLFIYEDFLGQGGFPNEIRQLVSHVPEEYNITVVCKDQENSLIKKNIEIIKVNSFYNLLKFNLEKSYESTVFFGFSSLYNFIFSLKLKSNYIIVPFSQINGFLDFDNPFEKNALPVVKSLENTQEKKTTRVNNRVKNGKIDMFSYLRALKRIIYRKIIGSYFLKRAKAIGVISEYEKKEIDDLYKGNSFRYLFYRLGSSVDPNKRGKDILPECGDSIKLVIWSRADFIDNCKDRNLDGSILTFIDEHKDPKWSFAKLDENKLVTQVKEKVVISEFATVGIYLFSKGKDFVNATIDMIIENERVNGEFYTCPTYNYAIDENAKIGIYNIEFEQMHGIGTPDDLNTYLEKIK